jgi:iron complex transport system substrate-binding protein
MSEREIDEAVSSRLQTGLGLYILDIDLIRDLRPDIIVTQSLCAVCAPSENEIAQLLASLDYRPDILYQTPHSLSDIFDCLGELGRALGRRFKAMELRAGAQRRFERILSGVETVRHRPRVFCMEWLDPVYCSGHWVPEMVHLAGGSDPLGREGADSVRIDWRQVLDWAPEVLVLMSCGYDLRKTLDRTAALNAMPHFDELPAVQNGRVYAVDANSYFARPGPRIVEGAELMAHLIHPDRFGWNGPQNAFQRIDWSGAINLSAKEAVHAK